MVFYFLPDGGSDAGSRGVVPTQDDLFVRYQKCWFHMRVLLCAMTQFSHILRGKRAVWVTQPR